MGYPLQFALRYLGSRKRASISVGTAFAILGVSLGVAALATIMSVTGGFHQQFREKVLGVNAHVLVLKYSTNFGEYRDVMERVAHVRGVIGVAPFSINPMMLTHGDATATGVLVKGVDPELSLGTERRETSEWPAEFLRLDPVLDLPKYIVRGSFEGLRRPTAHPAAPKGYEDFEYVPRPPPPATVGSNGWPPAPSGWPPSPAPTTPGSGPSATASAEPAPSASGAPATTRPRSPTLLPTPLDLPPEPAAPPHPTASASGAAGTGAATASAVAPSPGAPPPATTVRIATGEGAGGGPSALPEEDTLPPDLDADLCSNPEAVKALPGIVVGVALAKTLRLDLGDCVTVTSPIIGAYYAQGRVRPPVAVRFRVIAMFEAGFDQYDSKLVYTDLYEAQNFYKHGDTVTGVEMRVDDIDRAREIAREIDGLLPQGVYHTMDWEELNHGLFTALRIQQVLMSGVLALIIVVAAFTVVATLIMVVLDKRKEISVLKAMGATNEAILRIFVYQGGIIGLLGTGLGLLLGYGVCKGLLVYGFPLDPKVYFISRLPVQVRPHEFVITGIIAIVICLVATILPSLYAARLRPADGFRQQ
ncbi:MAG: FtsX-like permease family protein [Polyangiaceae bacterium]|nr:FtsX-like permease family protein [Polyangiaceae bacterium]